MASRFLKVLYFSAAAFLAQAYVSVALAAGDDKYPEVEGLPQLDPSTYASQIFWLFITFTALYIFFAKRTLPDISSVIENRQERIQSDLDSAEQIKEEAEKVHQEYEENLEEARQNATSFYAEAEQDIRNSSSSAYENFKKKSEKEVQETEAAIEKAKTEAMGEMSTIAAEIAKEAAEKIIGISTDLDNAKNVVQALHKKRAA